jgi:hypothetical protein
MTSPIDAPVNCWTMASSFDSASRATVCKDRASDLGSCVVLLLAPSLPLMTGRRAPRNDLSRGDTSRVDGSGEREDGCASTENIWIKALESRFGGGGGGGGDAPAHRCWACCCCCCCCCSRARTDRIARSCCMRAASATADGVTLPMMSVWTDIDCMCVIVGGKVEGAMTLLTRQCSEPSATYWYRMLTHSVRGTRPADDAARAMVKTGD